MRNWIAGLLVAATLAAGAQEPARAGNSDRGMFIFSIYCASCHGEEGKGDGPMSARMIREFGMGPANLSSPAVQAGYSDADLTRAIREGGVGVHRTMYMPAWGLTLSEQQVRDVVAFVRELGEHVPTLTPPAPIPGVQMQLEVGRTLFSLYCTACHGNSGEGGGPFLDSSRQQGQKVPAPPDLSSSAYYWNVTDRTLAAYISSGFNHSGFLRLTARNRWWHRSLTPDETSALILYLRSLPFREKSKPVARP